MPEAGSKHSRIREMLTGAQELFVLPPTVEITGNTRVTMQCVRGILEYGEDRIRVRLPDLEACVLGSDLRICSLDQDSLEIRGCIERIEYR